MTRDGKLEPRLAPSTITEINSRLRDRPEAAAIMDRYVKELRLEDLEQVRDAIADGDAENPAPRNSSTCPNEFLIGVPASQVKDWPRPRPAVVEWTRA